MKNFFSQIDDLDKAIAEKCFSLNKEYINLKRFLTIFEFVYNGIPWFILTCLIYFVIEDEYWRYKSKIVFTGKL